MRRQRDLNREVAGWLQDQGLVHASRHGRIAYRRAALAVLRLDEDVDRYVERGTLRDIRHLGAASERVILEVLREGSSPSVARAVAESGHAQEIAEARRLREGFLSRAGALAVLATPARGVVGREDYRGDLQMHTTWSDGTESVADMAAAGRARDWSYIGVSDHAHGLRIAGGMSMADVQRQHEEIDRLNAGFGDGFRIVKAIEANLAVDGTLDLSPDEAATFELVLAAPHSALRKDVDQTPRMLAALRQPRVRVLAHPRGRMMSRRGVLAHWDEVFRSAADLGVAVELDGDPYRQDLDHRLAAEARAAGCLFAIDSDAHAGRELAYTDIALAHARLAGIPPERVINCWDVDRLLAWAGGAAPVRRGRAPGRRRATVPRHRPGAPRGPRTRSR